MQYDMMMMVVAVVRKQETRFEVLWTAIKGVADWNNSWNATLLTFLVNTARLTHRNRLAVKRRRQPLPRPLRQLKLRSHTGVSVGMLAQVAQASCGRASGRAATISEPPE